MKSSVSVYKRCRPLLGTFVEISLFGKGLNEKDSGKAFNQAFRAVEKISNLMSFHDPQSDLSLLNGTALKKWVKVGPDLVNVLKWALLFQKQSHGLFNVAVAQPLIFWDFLPGSAKTSGLKYLNQAGFEIKGNRSARRILPVKIDLGGIAKGYAVDQAVKILGKKEISGCVNAGGDMRVFGDTRQTVCVRTGRARQKNYFTHLQNMSLATSTIIPLKGRSPYVDIKKRKPARSSKTAVVIADKCVVADALTKIALLSPLWMAEKIAGIHGANLRIIP